MRPGNVALTDTVYSQAIISTGEISGICGDKEISPFGRDDIQVALNPSERLSFRCHPERM